MEHSLSVCSSAALLGAEALANAALLHSKRYVEIDYKAYMQEVQAVLDGERDYTKIQANTGPLVYPAGFVALFAALHYATAADPACCRLPQTRESESPRCVSGGGNLLLAQAIFAAAYLATLALVISLYRRARLVPPWAHALLILSPRIHSLYVLRLFNDGVAMLFVWLWLACACSRRHALGGLLFSAALSIKMNALLFAPALAILVLRDVGWSGAIVRAVPALGLQLLLAAPFLRANAAGYLSRAFELSRSFEYRWTVNWKCVSPQVFGSRAFSAALLASHVVLLLVFAHRKWCPSDGGLPALLLRATKRRTDVEQRSTAASDAAYSREVLTMALTCNFIGIATARTLHYQFYTYYFHSLPFLLWLTPLPTALRLALWLGIEWSFNVYPATPVSSFVLQVCHAALLLALLAGRGGASRATPPRKGND